MIQLKMCKIIETKSGKKITYQKTTIHRWPNDYEFPFDQFNPEEWRNFLKNFKLNGKKLPVKSMEGDEVGYEVLYFGAPKFLREKVLYYSGGKKSNVLNLFPGYPRVKEDHVGPIRQRNIAVFGKLK